MCFERAALLASLAHRFCAAPGHILLGMSSGIRPGSHYVACGKLVSLPALVGFARHPFHSLGGYQTMRSDAHACRVGYALLALELDSNRDPTGPSP